MNRTDFEIITIVLGAGVLIIAIISCVVKIHYDIKKNSNSFMSI